MVHRSSTSEAREMPQFNGIELLVVIPFGHREKPGFEVCGNSKEGIFISRVEPDSAAAQADLRVGDQILLINGLRNITADQAETLHITSDNSELELVIRRAENPEFSEVTQHIVWRHVNWQKTFEEPERWDVAAKTTTIKVKQTRGSAKFSIRGGLECGTGIYISHVEKPSAAWKAGLRAGMRLVSVNKLSVWRKTHEATCNLIRQSLSKSKSMELEVQNLSRYPLGMTLDGRVAPRKTTAAADVFRAPGASYTDGPQSAVIVNTEPPETESNDTDTTSNNDTVHQSAASPNPLGTFRNSHTTHVGAGALLQSMLNETTPRDSSTRIDALNLPSISITLEEQVQPSETNVTATNVHSQPPTEPTKFERTRNNTVSFSQNGPEMIPNAESLPGILKNGINALDESVKPSSVSTPSGVPNRSKKGTLGRQKPAFSLDVPSENLPDHKADPHTRRKDRHDRQAARMLQSVSFIDEMGNGAETGKLPEKLNARQKSKAQSQPKSTRSVKEADNSSSRSASEYSSSDSDESEEVQEAYRPRKTLADMKKIPSQDDSSSARRNSPVNTGTLRDIANTMTRTKRQIEFWKKYSAKFAENGESEPPKSAQTDRLDVNSTLKKSTSNTSLSSTHREPVKNLPTQITEEDGL